MKKASLAIFGILININAVAGCGYILNQLFKIPVWVGMILWPAFTTFILIYILYLDLHESGQP